MPGSQDDNVERLCIMKCPCGLDLEMPLEWAGQRVACPRCWRSMVVAPDVARDAKQATVPRRRPKRL